MPVVVLTLLKAALLVALFLFIAWSFRVVLRQLRETTEPASAAPDTTLARIPELQVVEPEEHRGTRIPLAHDMKIGRSDDCSLQLDDGYVSSHHARIVARGDDFFVEDAGSRNGTFVNRRQIEAATLIRRGDMVQIGRTVMEVVT